MKCARNKTTCARSVELFVDVHVVKRHAIVDVLCRPVVNVVIGVHIVVLFVPLVAVHFVVLILFVVILYLFIPLFSRSHFSFLFSLYSHGILGVVFTQLVSWSQSLMNLVSTKWELCFLPCAGCCLMLQNVEVNESPRKRGLSRRTLAGNRFFWSES